MMYPYNMWGWGPGWFITLMPLLVIWSLFWKAWALWIAARQGQKIWFGALLVINTLGILEIIYIFWASKLKIDVGTFQAPPVENNTKPLENNPEVKK